VRADHLTRTDHLPHTYTVVVLHLSVTVIQVPSHSAVFINEPRLSEFKQLVVSKGIQAEMSGGVLICNNVVAVRRV